MMKHSIRSHDIPYQYLIILHVVRSIFYDLPLEWHAGINFSKSYSKRGFGSMRISFLVYLL